jgi:hypothetical protein
LKQDAAQQTFIDIAEDHHNLEEVEKLLSLTDNMPLAINLMAHLVDVQGCSNVLSRWEEERTSLISEGYDKRSNLDLSISLSLSSPRIKAVPQAKDLLSLLSMLPDGLSDIELCNSNLPIDHILDCKTALIRTALAYIDAQKHLKALVPIREYMQKMSQPSNHIIRPLMKYFQDLLEFYKRYSGTQKGSAIIAQISSNAANIQNLLQNGLQPNHPDFKDIILCAVALNSFSMHNGKGAISLLSQLLHILPHVCDHRLEASLISEFFASYRFLPLFNPVTLVVQVLEHFKHFEDSDLKCRSSAYSWSMNIDISFQVNSITMLDGII